MSFARPFPAGTAAPASGASTFGNVPMMVLLAFVTYMWLQTAWAANVSYHIEGAILFTKYAILYAILFKLLTNVPMLEGFAWSHIIGCLAWGWEAYGREVRGRFEIVLGPGIDDSNVIGFHMITGLAFAGFMFISLGGWKRWVALLPIPFMLNLLILTASRGAVLGLVVAGATAAWLGPRAHRTKLLGCGVLAIPLFFMLAQSELFWERTGTISVGEKAERDMSSLARIAAAEGEWRMFLDNPLSARYIAAEFLTGGRRSAHNTTMAVLADHGVPGILLYVVLHGWVFFTLWKLKRLDKQGLPAILGSYRAAIGAGLVATLVCGLFVNLLKAEVAVWLIGMLVVVEALSRQAIAEAASVAAAPAPAPPAIAAAPSGLTRFPRPAPRVQPEAAVPNAGVPPARRAFHPRIVRR
jgi:hypothetical protein